jgi:hypothetical protein
MILTCLSLNNTCSHFENTILYRTSEPTYEGCVRTIIDFEQAADGTNMTAGQCVQNEWLDIGVTFPSNGDDDTGLACLVDTSLVEGPAVVLGRYECLSQNGTALQ